MLHTSKELNLQDIILPIKDTQWNAIQNIPKTEQYYSINKSFQKGTVVQIVTMQNATNILLLSVSVRKITNKPDEEESENQKQCLFCNTVRHWKDGKIESLGSCQTKDGELHPAKMVTVLNRFGHCVNYNFVEEMDTAAGSSIKEHNHSCPAGCVHDLTMRITFDNFDELCQTLSGRHTLHDTMGIMYPNMGSEISTPGVSTYNAQRTQKKKKINCI